MFLLGQSVLQLNYTDLFIYALVKSMLSVTKFHLPATLALHRSLPLDAAVITWVR